MKPKEYFDEKQIIDRGNAFKYGFIAMFVAFLLYRLCLDFEISQSLKDSLFYAFLWIPITITLIILILKDAYERVNSTGGKAVLTIIGATGLFTLVCYIVKTITRNLSITFYLGEMFMSLCMITICVVYWVKQYHDKKNYSED